MEEKKGSKRIRVEKYPGVYYRLAKCRSLVKDKSGRRVEYEKVYYCTWKTPEGKKVEAKCGGEFRDAMTPARAAAMRSDFLTGKKITRAEQRKEAAANPTLAVLWEKYKADKLTVKSARSWTSSFKLIPDRYKQKRPYELTAKDIHDISTSLIERGYAPQTRKHALSLIGRITRWGVRQQLCKPLEVEIELPKVDNKKTEFLDDKHHEMLIKALDEDINYETALVVKFITYTGVRKSAAFNLTWGDIDFEHRVITLRGQHAKSGITHMIPMSQKAMEVLQSVPRHDNTDLVFPSPTGIVRDKLPPSFIQRIKRKADIPADFRFLHGLRHSFASRLASSGEVTLFELQHLLTHESQAMTQRYAHLVDSAFSKAREAIDKVL